MFNSRNWIIFLLSTTLISLELVWTRIYSAEFFYTFSFLILSVAILGLGLGALTLRLIPALNNRQMLGVYLLLTAVLALIAPPLIFKLGLQFKMIFSDWVMLGKLVITIVLLTSAFFTGGLSLSLLFRNYHKEMPKLYMMDMVGAGVGVLVIMLVMNAYGTPLATFLLVLPVIVAAMLSFRNWMRLLPLFLLIPLIVLGSKSESLLKTDRKPRAPIIHTHWDALSKIKIYDFGEDYRGIEIDNLANSPVFAFDGDYDSLTDEQKQFQIPVTNLVASFDSCTFLSLGAGGGGDVFQALIGGATEVHAVEVNPYINHLMTDGELADFSGNIYSDPRVKVITEDARSYVRRFENKFDVIYSLSSNTFAALASGSFALAENYLFTVEAYRDYWNSLTEDGYMMMEHQFYMPRIVSEVQIALEKEGVINPEQHFAVYNFPQLRRNVVLISKRPLTDAILHDAIYPLTQEYYSYIYLLYPPADSLADNTINQIVLNGWKAMQDSSKTNLAPCYDNNPFVAQQGMWSNLSWDNFRELQTFEFKGFPLAKLIIVVILLIAIFIAIPLNLIPYLTSKDKLRAAPWFYFFALGMGYMIVEIMLIQKYTMFIGASIYSIITVLLTMLIASGIGSFFSGKARANLLFPIIMILILFDMFVSRALIYQMGGLTQIPRVLVTIALVFPLGFFMGMPFPKGSVRVGELVDWGFAVNGTASVIGSTLVMLIAFNFGIATALGFGLVMYGLAFGLYKLNDAWE